MADAISIANNYLVLPTGARRRVLQRSTAGAASDSPDPGWKDTEAYRLLNSFLNGEGVASGSTGAPSQGSLSASKLDTGLRIKFSEAIVSDLRATRVAERSIKAAGLIQKEEDEGEAQKWPQELRLLALRVLKELGRLPGGSAPIASPTGLKTLIQQVSKPRLPEPASKSRSLRGGSSSSSSSSSSHNLTLPFGKRRKSRSPKASTVPLPQVTGVVRAESPQPQSDSQDGGSQEVLRDQVAAVPLEASASGPANVPDIPRRSSSSSNISAPLEQGSDSAEEASNTPSSDRPSSPDVTPKQKLFGSAIEEDPGRRERSDGGDSDSVGGTTIVAGTPELADHLRGESTGLNALDWEISDMALRCLNNTLFLHEQSRAVFAGNEVNGGAFALDMLKYTSVAPVDIPFLCARLIFFCTLFETEFNKTAVESLNAIDILTESTNSLISSIGRHQRKLQRVPSHSSDSGSVTSSTSSHVTKTASTDHLKQILASLSELLKAFFNLSLYYPRFADESTRKKDSKAIVGESFHSALLPMLDPVVRLIILDPPTTPPAFGTPITNAVAVLLNYPVKQYRSTWFQRPVDPSVPSEGPSQSSTLSTAKRFAQNIFSKGSKTSAGKSASPSSSPGFLSAGSAGTASSKLPPLLQVLVDILDRTTARYFPSLDVDSPTASTVAAADGQDVEDLLQPLILLVRKIVVEDVEAKSQLRNVFLPSDIDRSIGIDKREDVTGRLVRLMSSAIHGRLRRAAGELLLALFDGNPQEMTAHIGYGPCIGFLVSVNLGNAVPKPTEAPSTSSGSSSGAATSRPINPITGTYEAEEAERAQDAINQMTEEEKEVEAEKLFTLFDRINKTGVMKVENPMQKPETQSRFEEIQDEEDRRAKDEEDEEEREALRELEKWRAERRKKRI